MEYKQPLPHSVLILVFGILSILTCCFYGVFGLLFGIVALVLANKSRKLYIENPGNYTGLSNVNTGRVLAIIGIILSSLYVLILAYVLIMIGPEALSEMQNEWLLQQRI